MNFGAKYSNIAFRIYIVYDTVIATHKQEASSSYHCNKTVTMHSFLYRNYRMCFCMTENSCI